MLFNKTAIITGATRGIGLATMRIFAENHANIFILARKITNDILAEIEMLKKKNNIEIIFVECDISDGDSIKNAVNKILKVTKNIDILVNNAGMVAESTNFQMMSFDKLQKIFNVNFFGMTILTQYISRIMMRNMKGNIVNIASVAGIDGTPAQYEYVCSKAAVIGATKELAIELGKYNIRVNAIAPGITDTSMSQNIKDDLKNDTLNNTIMKRMGNPEEIANAILFMASDMASYITGQVLRVDGGTI